MVRASRRILLAGAALALLSVSARASASPVSSTDARIFANPASNTAQPPLANDSGNCTGDDANGFPDQDCASPCYPSYSVQSGGSFSLPLADTPACTQYILTGINAAQAQERDPAIVLPTNYSSLNVPEQLFVLANLERVTRRIPPYVGLVPYLDTVATEGARRGGDPVITAVRYDPAYQEWAAGPIVIADGFEGGTSIWSGGNSTPADAMFGWMYDDGWAGTKSATLNYACTSAISSGCWGHRDNILGDSFGPTCATCVAGAGFAGSTLATAWPTSYAMIFLEPANRVAMSFTWNADVLPYLSAPYERVRAR